MIPVTKAFLPSQSDYQTILEEAWSKGWITNRGTLVTKLEGTLKQALGVSDLILTTNGTLPIQIAIKTLRLKGEIITTPFSYVATTSAIVWEGCKPVFVDIHPEYWTIDEEKIEESITENTSAILATHVFGNPCHLEKLSKIAEKHQLKLIYDAAHSFGVKVNGESIFNYGDVSTCSFHATKLFHTGEGGAIFSSNKNLIKKMFSHHNFGHDGPEKFHGLGINAKMSELQAAMGLSVFPHLSDIVKYRRELCEAYESGLNDNYKRIKYRENSTRNYSYMPVITKDLHHLKRVLEKLNENDIFPRRYFYPSLNKLPYVEKKSMPICEDIADRVLCLPLYYGLNILDVKKIIEILNTCQ